MFSAVNARSFGVASPLAAQVARAANAGFDGVELALEPPAAGLPHATAAECRTVVAGARDLGIQICGLATNAFWTVNFASPRIEDRQAAIDLTLAMLDRAAALNAGVVLVVPAVIGTPDSPRPGVTYADALHYTLEALSRLRFAAEDRGVVIALETAWNRFLLSPIELADLIDRVGSPSVGACLDIGRVSAYGCAEDWIATLGHRLRRLHANDYSPTSAAGGELRPIGEGHVDWPAVMAAARDVGYDGPLTCDVIGDASDARRRVTRLIADSAPVRGRPS